MYSCAFFGHRDNIYEEYKQQIERAIIELIEKKNVVQFYSGYRGYFDINRYF